MTLLAFLGGLAIGLTWVAQKKPGCKSCGHESTAHKHYRTGTDCGLCECKKMRRI